MKKFKLYTLLFLLVIASASCKRDITLNLNNNTGLLVIEGNITNQRGPQYIKLSQNVAFTSANTYPPVTGATVSVTDDIGNSYPFTEGPAGTYSISRMAGIAGATYAMHVLTGGKTYTASSTMPDRVELDSITTMNAPFGKNNQKQIVVHYQDPASVANQYRFVMYVNSVQVDDVFANDDQFTDGRYVNYTLFESDINIYPGDTVSVEMQCIDKNIYTYWFSLMQQQPNGPGGGVTPSNPPTNITPATLGYFSAHTTQTRTIVVK